MFAGEDLALAFCSGNSLWTAQGKFWHLLWSQRFRLEDKHGRELQNKCSKAR